MDPARLDHTGMAQESDNVVEFPLHKRRPLTGCPQCGRRDDVWQIGRVLWAYCERHEVRWVVANQIGATKATINRTELRKGLEFLFPPTDPVLRQRRSGLRYVAEFRDRLSTLGVLCSGPAELLLDVSAERQQLAGLVNNHALVCC